MSDELTAERTEAVGDSGREPERGVVTLATIGRFLIGRRDAIVAIVESRQALWLGLLLVLSAGFAREYDGEDLWREPWHLLIPLAASLGSSLLLYCLVYVVGMARGAGRAPFWRGYRRLLTAYWMTAPLAWLYAVPLERVLTAGDAVTANLWLLAIVAAWRVVLMIRVVSVLYQCHWLAAFWMVGLFADALAVAAIALSPKPVVMVMGGIRQSEAEVTIAVTSMLMILQSFVSLPIFLLAVLVLAGLGYRKAYRTWSTSIPESPRDPRVARPPWIVAAMSLVCWVFVLPATQAEQRNRWKATHELKAGRVEQAIRFMSERDPGDFPPHWDPPPRLGYSEWEPPLHEVIDASVRLDAAPWVRELYLDKLRFQLLGGPYQLRPLDFEHMTDEQLDRLRLLLSELDDGPALAAAITEELERQGGRAPASMKRRETIDRIRALAESDS